MINTKPEMYDHFSNVAASYNALRRTDLEPILYISERLNGHSTTEAADIGCGAGRYCLGLFQNIDNLHLTCVDCDEAMLEQISTYLTQAGISNFKTLKSFAENVPLGKNSMDVVFTFNAIHHFDFPRFMERMTRILRDEGCIFIYTRLRSRNARNIWGRYFPLFLQKEDRLYELSELEELIASVPSVTLESVERFRYWRISTVDRLLDLARSNHYSTFPLYQRDEFEASLKEFRRNLLDNYSSSGKVGWFDEYTMLVIRKHADNDVWFEDWSGTG